jgi:hypothetical protein
MTTVAVKFCVQGGEFLDDPNMGKANGHRVLSQGAAVFADKETIEQLNWSALL